MELVATVDMEAALHNGWQLLNLVDFLQSDPVPLLLQCLLSLLILFFINAHIRSIGLKTGELGGQSTLGIPSSLL